LPVTEVNGRYGNSPCYDDDLEITTELGRVSLSFSNRMPGEANQDLLATGSTKHACIDHNGKVTRIPTMLLDAAKALAR
jgi:acyl-CoA thioesterase FadM